MNGRKSLMARREEWQEQNSPANSTNGWTLPARTGLPTDHVASSPLSGAIRKQRGVKPGVPDILVLYRGKLIAIELKSRHGQCSQPQRAAREALLRAGALWWVCRSANAAMWALYGSGVSFRTIVHQDGTQPELPPWEVPKRNPHERRPRAPEWEPEAVEIAEPAAADAA
jgi:hypothetical protein